MKQLLFFPVLILLCIPALMSGLSSCDKEPEVIIKTDTLVIIDTIIDFQILSDTATTFLLVRHAEVGSGSNPNLSASGQARVTELNRILGEVDLNAVYSTNFNRTLQTAQPIATAKGLTVTQYDAFAPNALIDNVLLQFPEGVVLVVGHSNTTADMLNAMVGSNTFAEIPESEFDNLYIVHVSERGKAKATHLKYGM